MPAEANSGVKHWWGETVHQGRVLIVDDDRSLSSMVAFVLRQYGYSVDIANSGDDGLSMVSSQNYDAVVLDLRMPGKDGRTVFREMRAAGVSTPVMILSAFDARRARDELGAEGFMNKPFEPEALADSIRRMLDAK
jgi:DNA-binding response OmpR family regulator